MRFRICSILRLALFSVAAVWFVLLSARGIGFHSPITAFCAVGVALGIVVANASTIRWAIPKGLLPVRAWETSGSAYALLGISIFGWLLQRAPLRYFNTSVYTKGRRADLRSAYANLLYAEAAHFWAFIFTMPLAVYELARPCWHGIGWLFLFNTLVNVYPGLHLRQARARLEPLLRRHEKRKKQ